MNTSKGKQEAVLSDKELIDFLGPAAFPQTLKRPENPFVKEHKEEIYERLFLLCCSTIGGDMRF
ncbi:hypothetical protein QFZ20_001391 [Flavobacterium sp. W4I14]|nr:hypothetical protein [Flavobacterium sp. W4I14]